MHGFWWHHATLIVPMIRVMIPALFAVIAVLFRVSPLAAAILAVLNTVVLAVGLWFQAKRIWATRSWHSWGP